MRDCTAGSKITCEIRCLDPAVVEAALGRLDPAGVEWVSYRCQLSGQEESILLLGDELASHLTESLPTVDDAKGAKIVAGLYSAELCECDVATFTGLPEEEVISQLRSLAARGVVTHRRIHGMNYYRLESSVVRRTIDGTILSLSTRNDAP